jgi:hypothetical protein
MQRLPFALIPAFFVLGVEDVQREFFAVPILVNWCRDHRPPSSFPVMERCVPPLGGPAAKVFSIEVEMLDPTPSSFPAWNDPRRRGGPRAGITALSHDRESAAHPC